MAEFEHRVVQPRKDYQAGLDRLRREGNLDRLPPVQQVRIESRWLKGQEGRQKFVREERRDIKKRRVIDLQMGEWFRIHEAF